MKNSAEYRQHLESLMTGVRESFVVGKELAIMERIRNLGRTHPVPALRIVDGWADSVRNEAAAMVAIDLRNEMLDDLWRQSAPAACIASLHCVGKSPKSRTAHLDAREILETAVHYVGNERMSADPRDSLICSDAAHGNYGEAVLNEVVTMIRRETSGRHNAGQRSAWQEKFDSLPDERLKGAALSKKDFALITMLVCEFHNATGQTYGQAIDGLYSVSPSPAFGLAMAQLNAIVSGRYVPPKAPDASPKIT